MHFTTSQLHLRYPSSPGFAQSLWQSFLWCRFQQERCLCIVEEIHHSLCALTSLAIHSDHIQAPKMLDQIAQYAVALQKFDSCLKSQRDLGTIKRLFKQGEISAQLDSCETELKTLLGDFTVKQIVQLATAVVELNIDTETRHQELLELISSKSSSCETVSLIARSSSNASSSSFSLLPASPKIFHGRECHLEELVDILMADPARVAVLGPGGMGKTTLEMAALHHPKVAHKYQTRYFISCESVHTRDSFVAIIPCLMILDNFETLWEAPKGRERVEAFLALLADIPHVALLLTMRGAERPGKVQWTHPFLRPLMPLDQAAAHQTFIEIADEIHDGEEVDQLLEITGNIPLAVQLVAGVAASIGCQETMERWNLERTALLSSGYDKRSNLDISITLSLTSPHLLASPHAVELLSLMSLLPDGISHLDLVQSNIPIQDILDCKTTLVRTSLAYVDHAGRFKVLAPMREYIQATQPPSLELVRPLRKYLIDLLELYTAWWNASTFVVDLVPRLVSNLGNLHSVLQEGLESDHNELRESVLGILLHNDLSLTMNRGLSPLMLRLPEILSGMDDQELYGRFITEALESKNFYTLPDPERAIEKATEFFRLLQNHDREARLYDAIARYYFEAIDDPKKAEHYFQLAVSVASQSNSHITKLRPLAGLSLLEYNCGNYSKSLQLAKEVYRIGRASGNVRGELQGVRLQALCYSWLGNFRESLELLNEGKELIVRAGVQGGQMEIFLMNDEAIVHQYRADYSGARRIQEAMLRQTSAVLSPVEHGHALVNITSLDIVTGADANAVSRNLDAALTAFQSAQYPRGILFCDFSRAALQLREGDTMGARAEYIRLFSAVRDHDNKLAWNCLEKLADCTEPVHAEMESARWAVIFLAFALRPVERSPLIVHQALRRLGDVLARQSAGDMALSILTIALDGFTQMDVHQSRAECMRTIGDVYVRHGDLSKAREIWEAARPLFERSEQQKEVTRLDERLQTLDVAQKFEALPEAELPALQGSDTEGEEQKPHSLPEM
ncbi:hypothetical protein C8R44DRAFT_860986 [Mycena epipterygia]|nr:hypothetical protein C8R44DRAFT_860986 [Mycena epipterygia]